MSAAAIVVAAGAGRRMGGERPKQFLMLGGEPVLRHAISPFLDHPGITTVVVVLAADHVASPPRWLADLPVLLQVGGAERGDSVRAGLELLPDDVDRVLIHDGARPLVPSGVVDRVLEGAGQGGVIAALPVHDTIKEVSDGVVVGSPDRSSLYRAQTPQGFPRDGIVEAYRRALRAGERDTDDAALYARHVGPVRVVAGAESNLKITRPEDLRVAEMYLSERTS